MIHRPETAARVASTEARSGFDDFIKPTPSFQIPHTRVCPVAHQNTLADSDVPGYTKLFNSILMSSLWEESAETRIVWVTLLALADMNGHVDGTVRSLARVARVSLKGAQTALNTFLAPDPMDRSGVDEGRRIHPHKGGWAIVNHASYRHLLSNDERRERDKLRKRSKRAMSAARPQMSAGVRVGPQSSANVRDVSQAEAEADRSYVLDRSSPIRKTSVIRDKNAPSSPPHARSKHPVFKGERFVVFDWQLEDLTRLLGNYAESFDLHSWFFDLDEQARRSDMVIPQRDGGAWLQAQTLAEAQRRGLQIAVPDNGSRKPSLSARMAAMVLKSRGES